MGNAKKVAVTGSRGFIPSYLVKELNKKYKVLEIDIKSDIDVTRIGFLSDYLEGVDTVFHLATLPLPLSLTNPYMVANEIYLMSLTLCELLRQRIFKTLIQVSSSEAYGTAQYIPMDEHHPLNPTTPYAAAKASADLLALSYYKTFGVDVRIVRPFNNYGPGQPLGGIIPSTIDRILHKKRPIITGNGEQERDFIFVSDTIEGILKIWSNPKLKGEVINIAGGNPIKIYQLVNLISDLMDYGGKYDYITERKADVEKHFASIDKAICYIGFLPKVNLETGLRRTIAWYRKYSR